MEERLQAKDGEKPLEAGKGKKLGSVLDPLEGGQPVTSCRQSCSIHFLTLSVCVETRGTLVLVLETGFPTTLSIRLSRLTGQ